MYIIVLHFTETGCVGYPHLTIGGLILLYTRFRYTSKKESLYVTQTSNSRYTIYCRHWTPYLEGRYPQ